MKSVPTLRQEQAVDRIARQITARLSEGEALLPYEVTERLRASREQAVSIRRREVSVLHAQTSASASAQGSTLTLGSPDEGNGWWRTLVSAIPVFALIAGLVIYNSDTEQSMLSEVAEVDTALLTDDLPPAAYADPGFIQYLKTSAATPSEH
ncbi:MULTISPECIES: DUF3619 family protein [Comamonas]|jgi:hypothetical protein|uniref:DUF3619 family protein n=1 Tax=Comamonas TaxID=283 RepID=UPI0012C83D15|nr:MULTISPECIES: DUF3619 family protein [Comamonas]MDR3066323.1 DUF3619 family protein [Comamonas sp.]MEB5964708.1 DUF3619 family protein [Comamonas testosteroni]MPS93406.1 DUF3619 family protein [Comamonas sp.]